ncbi:MAG: tRNA (adenosine(37)-N6)-threonylcarbamoyltransferase complex ATPase subunit type 1 TsaE [Acidobacteria bacterium]|nr:tRNA (adenosine(37)-N6)-threonylcarbamoyltransferase complex ATPase subunit type 1 TsaE [Acidobacteriota bacterium]
MLLYGGLGAGKTLLTKGILDALDFDIDEVTSPSFTLVNLYRTSKFDVYHIDLWRVEDGHDPVTSVGLDEILEPEDSLAIIEWADRLGNRKVIGNVVKIRIEGDGDAVRKISISTSSDHRVEIRKGDRRLDLYRGDVLVGSYDAALGFAPEGQKRREGDGKTPEGEFFIFAKNPKSRHYLSLAISYPDMTAVDAGLENGVIDENTRNQIVYDLNERQWIPQETPLGGRIYIHGGGTASDWTDGCIALQDNEMQEVYDAVGVGTRVRILP